jgi:RNA polymerase sigma-32 factor
LGVDVKNVHEMEGRLSAYDMGFDAPTDADDDESYKSPVYYLEDHSQDPATLLEHEDTESSNSDMLVRGLDLLDERSRDIVERRWLSEEKDTLNELADEYGVSAERIRQIEAAAMKKIRKLIEEEER